MGWEEFMQMERRRLWERREGKLLRALGVALPGEYIDDLSSLDMRLRTAAEWLEVAWLKERLARRKKGTEAPPMPTHLR